MKYKFFLVISFFVSSLFITDLFPTTWAYFSPHDNIKDKVLQYMKNEEKSICVAVYWLTDKDYINEAIKAVKRGVKVEIIVDKETMSSYVQTLRKNIIRLTDAGVKILVYGAFYGTMHNKFCVFEKNKGIGKLEGKPRSIAYTGSFNLTWKANFVNQENVIFFDDPEIVKLYKERFKRIKAEVTSFGQEVNRVKRSIKTRYDHNYGDDESINIEPEDALSGGDYDDEAEALAQVA
ncbi:DUF1669 domain-containing protein [bacterium]|jgi:phosphatidylserine/phosphatidylglycerophosphate/cardiolipin synthase-like enzyme|nr:DUF1669 domain-containing protein [bacterium]